MMEPAVLQKAWNAKDYGRLIPVQKTTADGKRRTYWMLPEDARQKPLFDGDTEGKEAADGKTGYFDHVADNTHEYQVKPLLKLVERLNPSLGPKFQYKYDNYVWDRETRDLDIKVDELFVDYTLRRARNQGEKDLWDAEFEEKVVPKIKMLNNRKQSMLRAKVGMRVKFRGVDAEISGTSRRGFPVVKTAQGTYDAFWEEVAQSVIDDRS